MTRRKPDSYWDDKHGTRAGLYFHLSREIPYCEPCLEFIRERAKFDRTDPERAKRRIASARAGEAASAMLREKYRDEYDRHYRKFYAVALRKFEEKEARKNANNSSEAGER